MPSTFRCQLISGPHHKISCRGLLLLCFLITCTVWATLYLMSGTFKTSIKSYLKDVKKRPQPDLTNRWGKWIYDTFDVPHPLQFRLGAENKTFKDKYVIYRCDTDWMSDCGGLADRLRGIFTSYLIANLTGRTFKAEILMPYCPFEKFFIPNRVDWSVPESFHKMVIPSERVKILDMFVKPEYYDQFSTINFVHHPFMNSDYVYMKSSFDNMDNFRRFHKMYGNALHWMHDESRSELNRFLFSHLLRPSTYMRNKLISFLKQHVKPMDKLICAHLRMGQNPSMPDDFKPTVNLSSLSIVSDFLRLHITEWDYVRSKIFIMSDSLQAINILQAETFGDRVFSAPGPIVHIDLSKNVTDRMRCQGFEKVIFEELILMQCDTLIVSSSGLSRLAAYVRGHVRDLYCFQSNSCKPCYLSSLKYVHQEPRH